jgi:hypothetical protein
MNIFLGLAMVVIGLVFAAGLSTQKYVEGSCGKGDCVFETHRPKALPLGFGIVLIGGGLYVASRKSAKQKVADRLKEQQEADRLRQRYQA